MSKKQILFDVNSTSPTSAIINVGENACVQIRAYNLGPGEEVLVELVSLTPGSYPAGVINSCLPNPIASGPQVVAVTPYSPCGYQQFLLDETRNTIVIRSAGFYQFQLSLAALGTAIVEAIFYEGEESCNAIASECCCQPEIAWLGTSTNPCLTITPGGPAGHSPVFGLDACCLLQALPANPNPVLSDRLIFLSGPDCFTATIDEIFSMAVVCDSLGEFGILAPAAGDTLVALDAGAVCKRVDAQTMVTDFETPWTGTSNNPNLTITPGGVNGHAPVFDYDLCADVQAIPSCACVPNTGDGVLIIQGGDCVLATWPAVDLCEQIGLLPLGGVLPDDRIPVREAGGACKYLPASTFLGGAVLVPLNEVLDATADATRDHTDFAITWNWERTSFGPAFSFGEAVATSGFSDLQQPLVNITTLDGSTAAPFVVYHQVGNVASDYNIAVRSGGELYLAGSLANGIRMRTALTDRLFIDTTGEWALAGVDPGTLGQVITSQGPGTPPIWTTPGASPILGADGSCVAPTYSFATDATTGMFYDPASPVITGNPPAVVIGYDDCGSRVDVSDIVRITALNGDFIEVGASINITGDYASGSQIAILSGDRANVTIRTGPGNGQTSGDIIIEPGLINGGGVGGRTIIRSGEGVGFAGSSLQLEGGTGTIGGPIFIQGGFGQSGSGGSIDINGGLAAAGFAGGGVSVVAGASDTTPGTASLTGGVSSGLVEGGPGIVRGGTAFAPGGTPGFALLQGGLSAVAGFGAEAVVQGGGGLGSIATSGDVVLASTDPTYVGPPRLFQVQRLRIHGPTGEWRLGGFPGIAGTAGQVITSQGLGLPPVWGTIGASPILGADGSCAAPTYSFTSSPDSGMFYDPAGVGSVVIGDDNCVDSIAIGASITISTNSVTRHVYSNSGEWLVGGTAGVAGQAIVSNGAGAPPTWQTPAGVAEPITQIVYGTGPAVDSSPFHFWNVATGAYGVNSSTFGTPISFPAGGGGFPVFIFAATNSTGIGQTLNLAAGIGGGDNGGQFFLSGGNTTVDTRTGGNGTIRGGDALGPTGSGGSLTIRGGNAIGGSSGSGSVNINMGDAPGGGNAITAANVHVGVAGAVGSEGLTVSRRPTAVTSLDGITGVTGNSVGQDVRIRSGFAQGASGAAAGRLDLGLGRADGAGSRNIIRFVGERAGATLPLAVITGYGDVVLAGYGNGTNGGENTPVPAAATTGFAWLPRVDAAPSGVPAGTALAGGGLGYAAPCVIENTSPTLTLWAYDSVGGAWRSVLLT